uniref:Uncharacterized protein n=1 Tax=Glossina palpalis gambiensis TaxID=67801 RepID=A0A1B0BW59_9MUSC
MKASDALWAEVVDAAAYHGHRSPCKQLIVKPARTKSIVNKIKFTEILESSKKIFGIKNKSVNKIAIYKNDNVGGISEPKRLPNLIRGILFNCTLTSNAHVITAFLYSLTEPIQRRGPYRPRTFYSKGEL